MNITIQKPINVSMALERIKKEALTNGLSFSGDEKCGQGEGFGFKASYVVQTNAILITVHKKPFMISESRITKEVEKFWTRYLSEEKRAS